MTHQNITEALTDVQAAHHKYETTLGKRDDNWASWYANWLKHHSNEFDDYSEAEVAEILGDTAKRAVKAGLDWQEYTCRYLLDYDKTNH